MADIKKNERFVPTKNYVIAVFIVVAMILLTWYAFEWYNVYKENKVSISYLMKNKILSKEINDLNEVNDVFSEAPDSYFIYVSYTGDENIYEMEKDLSDLIIEYKLEDSMYFLNVTSIKDEKDYLDKVNKALSLKGDSKIKQVPTILYFKDGTVTTSGTIKKEDNNLIDAGDFQKLLDVNNISKE